MTLINLLALPAFEDNYIWVLHDGQCAVVVDPGDAAPVIELLDRQGLELQHILVTHHHPDHVGGLDALRPRLRGRVWAPPDEGIPGNNIDVTEGAVIDLPGCRATVLRTPGHTLGHVAYLVEVPGSTAPWLFCGDTLFAGGCGRLFEGTPAQMHASLQRLAALPPATLVCCAHEYTLANLRFARAVEPGNENIDARIQACELLRSRGHPTLPSTIESELLVNPYLRCHLPEVMASARRAGAPDDEPLSVFTALRAWKNRYR